jgi:hypothetical protein
MTFLQAYRVVVLPVANTWMSWSLLHKMSITPSGPLIVLLGIVLLACIIMGLQVSCRTGGVGACLCWGAGQAQRLMRPHHHDDLQLKAWQLALRIRSMLAWMIAPEWSVLASDSCRTEGFFGCTRVRSCGAHRAGIICCCCCCACRSGSSYMHPCSWPVCCLQQ